MPSRASTRFYVTESDYQKLLLHPGESLRIDVSPNKGNHPRGYYLIPNNFAIDFIKEKRGTPNWDKHKNFKQDSIPSGLERFFFRA